MRVAPHQRGRRGPWPRRALLGVALCVCGCSGDGGSQPADARASRAAPFELRDVVHARIDALTAELAATAAFDAPDPDLEQRLLGLAHELPGAQARWRTLYREEAAGLGDPAVEVLAALLADESLPDGARIGAIELIGAVDTPLAGERLLALVVSETDWIRRHAAFQLGETTQRWTTPALVLRLNYETDHETVVWLARTLARFDNFAGLDGLLRLERDGTEAIRALAAGELARQVEALGAPDRTTLYEAWHSSGSELIPTHEPSARERLAIWRLVLEISGERFQLRGVDDARFVLARCSEWVVACLAEALHDKDPWTRVHVAQCLDRMGARARSAAPELIAGLADPALAPAAAEALGGVGGPDAAPALATRLAPGNDHELRVAAARGLGRLTGEASTRALADALAPDEPADLRHVVAQSLARRGAGAAAVPFLLECLTAPDADPHGAELALEAWLRRTAANDERARGVLADWEALAPAAPDAAPTLADVTRRQAERRALLEHALPDLARNE